MEHPFARIFARFGFEEDDAAIHAESERCRLILHSRESF